MQAKKTLSIILFSNAELCAVSRVLADDEKSSGFRKTIINGADDFFARSRKDNDSFIPCRSHSYRTDKTFAL